MTSFSTIAPAELTLSAAEIALRARFEEWMRTLPARPERHARFVNTLSLLEHIGSVKIARTQSGTAITGEILQHLAEETRHAAYLKRIVGKIGVMPGADYADDYLLAGPAARGYFARLDGSVRMFVRREIRPDLRDMAAYRLVTWLVERRAMWLYPAYQQVLEEAAARLSVRSIIGEETRHLADIEAGLAELAIGNVEELVEAEERLFERLASVMLAA